MARRRGVVESDSDDEFLDILFNGARRAKKLRNRPDNLEEWSEEEFVLRFRISKDTTRRLLNYINDAIKFASDR